MVNRHAKVYMYLTKCHVSNPISLSITCREIINKKNQNEKIKKEKSEKKKMVIAEWICASGTAAPLALVESHSYHAHQLIRVYVCFPQFLCHIHVGMVWVHSWPRRCRTQPSRAYRSILIFFLVWSEETQTPSLLIVLDFQPSSNVSYESPCSTHCVTFFFACFGVVGFPLIFSLTTMVSNANTVAPFSCWKIIKTLFFGT